MKIYTTYRIIDPRDQAPVYVGQTINYETRKRRYLKRAQYDLPKRTSFNITVYLVLLRKQGYDPIFEVVDTQSTEEDSLESEKNWVAVTVESGFPVLNRWKKYRDLIEEHFSKNEVKKYFYCRFPEHTPEAMNNPYRKNK